ncbi:MAG: porin family protein [Bacteroidetes bacterium]|nr:porin family protein [Bacteroidota bacterium]
MLKYCLLTAILLVLTSIGYSQENYQQGCITFYNNDTLHGLIDYRNWDNNPSVITFKHGLSSASKQYKSGEIREFRVAYDVYVSAIVTYDASPLQPDRLTYDVEPKLRTDTVFLLTLVNGNKCLYYLKNHQDKIRFFIWKDNTFEELVYRKYLVKTEKAERVIMPNLKYKFQLIVYLQDCPSAKESADKAGYNSQSLIKLFKTYQGCIPTSVDYIKKPDKMKMEMGIHLGMTATSVKFKGDKYSPMVGTRFPVSLDASAGLYFDLVKPRNRGRWSFYNGLFYDSYRLKGDFNDHFSAHYYSVYSTNINLTYIRLHTMLRYRYQLKNMSLLFNGGMSNSLQISSENKLNDKRYMYGSLADEYNSKALDDLKTYDYGIIIGSGIRYGRFSAEVRFETGQGPASSRAFNAHSSTWYLLAGYCLN